MKIQKVDLKMQSYCYCFNTLLNTFAFNLGKGLNCRIPFSVLKNRVGSVICGREFNKRGRGRSSSSGENSDEKKFRGQNLKQIQTKNAEKIYEGGNLIREEERGRSSSSGDPQRVSSDLEIFLAKMKNVKFLL